MSDSIVKLIPADPGFTIPEETAAAIADALRGKIAADRVVFRCFPTPAFVDCGGDLEAIRCPLCGGVLDLGWWGEAMDRAYETSQFCDLSVTAPCCGGAVSLAALRYDRPCGFARVAFHLWNPAEAVDSALTDWLAHRLGTSISVITAHI